MSRRIASLAALLCWTVGCRPADPKTTDDPGSSDSVDTADTADTADTGTPTNDAYAMARFTHFELDLDPADWDTLRHETRNVIDVLLGDCQAEPFGSPFTWFPAQLTIDGEPIGTIDVRKKGFFGSLDEERPSLKLDLVEFDDDLHFLGVERFTLNNAISDPALVRQCVGYQVFADAGIPASRCNFARVTVNGVDLGVYVNVEPVKEPFLDRHFGDATGDLYEGTLTDFTPERIGTLEPKSNDESEDWSRVDALVAALEADDDVLLDELDADRLERRASLREVVLQNPLAEGFAHHWRGIVDAEFIGDERDLARSRGRRDAIDHAAWKGDIVGDPVVRVVIASPGEAQNRIAGDMAVLGQVVA